MQNSNVYLHTKHGKFIEYKYIIFSDIGNIIFNRTISNVRILIYKKNLKIHYYYKFRYDAVKISTH